MITSDSMLEPAGLRVALLTYRGNPHSGGQGVYTRHLARALTDLGHSVEVFSGQPYPELDPGVRLVTVPSLDLYRASDPFRTPERSEIRDWVDEVETKLMSKGTFPEPLTFGLRVRRLLESRPDIDVIHDNQCLANATLDLYRSGRPVLATVHHPLSVDRDLSMSRATTPESRRAASRWYAFIRMQERVARRLPALVAVSQVGRRDVVDKMGVSAARVRVIPLGVDRTVYHPMPGVLRVPGRVFAISSAHMLTKGLAHLLDALALLRSRLPHAHLVVVTRGWEDSAMPAEVERLGLTGAVTVLNDVPEEDLVRHYAEAEVAAVPSLYEAFCLPAVQAMACEVPLVSTTGGALPEVVGGDGECALTVPPGDASALAIAIERLMVDPVLAAHLAARARRRVEQRFSWHECASQTADAYRELIDATPAPVTAATNADR
ncbi:MAG: glycosyltransferase family 4 protein [Candidatus Dormibacteria bacterium]